MATPWPNVAKARLGFFPGSTIGNFLPGEARQFLENARRTLGAGSRMLFGADLVKPATVLEREYVELRGNVHVADTINEQAGFAVPAVSPVGDQSHAIGRNVVDFLGLGSQRTLTPTICHMP